MKVYFGNRLNHPYKAFVKEDGEVRQLEHIVEHSPTGLEWGYGGSGPSDLALSILTDYLGSKPSAVTYQKFKWDFVAKFGDEWKITGREIESWLNKGKV